MPLGWALDTEGPIPPEVDAVLVIRAPDGSRGRILIEAKPRATAADAARLGPRLAEIRDREGADGGLFISGYLSELSRKRLTEAGVSYLDLTGNVRTSLDRPALWILTQGAARDPSPIRRGARSLKGAKAGRLVRALCDWKPPVGVRELARRAGVDAGYTTRVLTLLEEENVVERGERGDVALVRWGELLALWAKDRDAGATDRVLPCLSPRGLEFFEGQLRAFAGRYALTASLAVPPEAVVAPVGRVTCFVDDPGRAASDLGLVETDSGSNVLLLRPIDPVVYERTRTARGLNLVAVSQCAADLLAGTGREPAQADALLNWMEKNKDAWRFS
jgi:hypothetical protein